LPHTISIALHVLLIPNYWATLTITHTNFKNTTPHVPKLGKMAASKRG